MLLKQGPLGLNPTRNIAIHYAAPSNGPGTYTVTRESMDKDWPQFGDQPEQQDVTGQCSACSLVTVLFSLPKIVPSFTAAVCKSQVPEHARGKMHIPQVTMMHYSLLPPDVRY
jgi:hypothetical protein